MSKRCEGLYWVKRGGEWTVALWVLTGWSAPVHAAGGEERMSAVN
jgi:hypothetical protein